MKREIFAGNFRKSFFALSAVAAIAVLSTMVFAENPNFVSTDEEDGSTPNFVSVDDNEEGAASNGSHITKLNLRDAYKIPSFGLRSRAGIYGAPINTKTILYQDFRTMDKLDPEVWNNTGTLPWGSRRNSGTGEIQTYTTSAVSLNLTDGLCFTAHRDQNGKWISGTVDTANKFSLARNTVATIRYKLPQNNGDAPGYCPAIWMHSNPINNTWVWPPELDVIEALGQDGFSVPHVTWHYDLVDPTGVTNTRAYPLKPGVETHPGPDVSKGWHTTTIDWRDDRLVVAHDNITTLNITNPDFLPKVSQMFLMLNFAIGTGGAGWAGVPDKTTPATGVFCVSTVKVDKILAPAPIPTPPDSVPTTGTSQ